MNARKDSEPDTTKNRTTVEPKSEREIVVTRTFDAPARIVFQAWTTPALFKRWWVPKSMPLALLSYEADIRAGGGYRLVFDVDGTKTMAFFGKYIEVTPHSRIVWTNDESGEDGALAGVIKTERRRVEGRSTHKHSRRHCGGPSLQPPPAALQPLVPDPRGKLFWAHSTEPGNVP